MAETRDPRTDPVAGDIIIQDRTGFRIKVTERRGDSVSWLRWKGCPIGWCEPNAWSIAGWESAIAKDARIEARGEREGGGDGGG